MPGPVEIDELLNRRSDLSTFVVHLTKGTGGTAKDNLVSILESGLIEARTPMGWLGTGLNRLSDPEHLEAMKVVCFSETPLEHAYSLFQEIPGRGVRLSSYGVAFTKDFARSQAANPVWYVNMQADHHWEIAPALDALREEARAFEAGFAAHPASKILPFFEQTGDWVNTRKQFSWEREWRHRGDFRFTDLDVALVLCPEDDIDDLESYGPYAAVDPSWSLERIIERIVSTRARYVEREMRRERRATAQAGQREET